MTTQGTYSSSSHNSIFPWNFSSKFTDLDMEVLRHGV